jgi:hypothetical protein
MRAKPKVAAKGAAKAKGKSKAAAKAKAAAEARAKPTIASCIQWYTSNRACVCLLADVHN